MIKQMFSGRIGIKQYWISVLLLIFIFIGVMLLAGLLVGFGVAGIISMLGAGPGTIIMGMLIAVLIATTIGALFVIPSWGLAVRRYHDVGLSIWVFLGMLIVSFVLSLMFPITPHEIGAGQAAPEFSLINFLINLPVFIVNLAILVWPGTKGDNKFGPQTKYSSIWNSIKGKKPESLSVADASAPNV